MDDLVFWAWATVIGMGVVFAVLAIVWLLLTLLMRADDRIARSAAGAGSPAGLAGATVAGAGAAAAAGGSAVRLIGAPPDLDPRLLAAITIAIVRHEEARRLQAAPAMRSYWPGSLLFASRWVAAGRTRQGQSWRRRR